MKINGREFVKIFITFKSQIELRDKEKKIKKVFYRDSNCLSKLTFKKFLSFISKLKTKI